MFLYFIKAIYLLLEDQSQIVQQLLLVGVFYERNKNLETLKVIKVKTLLDFHNDR